MPWKYTVEATCDKCGANLIPLQMRAGVANLATLESVKTVRWSLERQWSREGVLRGLPNLCGKRSMLCARCAGT